MHETRLTDALTGESFLEIAFLKWVLSAAAMPGIATYVHAQHPVSADDRSCHLDYLISAMRSQVVVELDGYEFHGSRSAFVHDRIRQNDLVCGQGPRLGQDVRSLQVPPARRIVTGGASRAILSAS
ncbi:MULTISPECIES: hypothetical protein [unclassified Nonomuraea]|uniref:hypothetical protein n=1 Tax=unclassified Nonomuraea TaxID=2593643 RepID=UPI00340DA4B8